MAKFKIEKLKLKLESLKQSFKDYKNKSIGEIWINDLNELFEKL